MWGITHWQVTVEMRGQQAKSGLEYLHSLGLRIGGVFLDISVLIQNLTQPRSKQFTCWACQLYFHYFGLLWEFMGITDKNGLTSLPLQSGHWTLVNMARSLPSSSFLCCYSVQRMVVGTTFGATAALCHYSGSHSFFARIAEPSLREEG